MSALYLTIRSIISRVITQEYKSDDHPTVQSLLCSIDNHKSELTRYQSWSEMVKFIKSIIAFEVNDPFDRNLISNILDIEITDSSSKPNVHPNADDLNLNEVPRTLSDFKSISSALIALSAVDSIVMNQLFGALYNAKNGDISMEQLIDAVLNDDSIDRLQQQMALNHNENAVFEDSAADPQNPVIESNGDLWKWSNIEVSTLWDIYSVYKAQTAYLKEGNPSLSINAFYDGITSIDSEELAVIKEATQYFENTVVQSLDFQHRFECLIEDDLRIYINVFVAFNIFINGFNPNYSGLDGEDSCYQFDVMIIPKSIRNLVTNKVVENGKDIDFDDKQCASESLGNDMNLNRFDAVNVITRKMEKLMDSLRSEMEVINDGDGDDIDEEQDTESKHHRFVLVLDRRTQNNLIILYRDDTANQHIADSNKRLSDGVMHCLTKRDALWQRLQTQRVFLFSLHFHSVSIRRLYWYFGHRCTRFFVSMLFDLWPRFFVINPLQIDYVKNHRHRIINMLSSFTLCDYAFDAMYRSLTGGLNVNHFAVARNRNALRCGYYDSSKYMHSLCRWDGLRDLNGDQIKSILIEIGSTMDMEHIVNWKVMEQRFPANLDGVRFVEMDQKSMVNLMMRLYIPRDLALSIFDEIHSLSSVCFLEMFLCIFLGLHFG